MKVAIIGAGWAGMAAAVEATLAGHQAIVFETARTLGGRARQVPSSLPDGSPVMLDNGQHILIGAYTETLRLMRQIGVQPEAALLQLPLTLLFSDSTGLKLPTWPTPLDALAGILGQRTWSLADKWHLLRTATRWQWGRYECKAHTTVAQLCQDLSPRVMAELIEPLCVSALNTPADRACGQVFLTVLRDSLFGVQGGSRLLLPRVDLTELFPAAAARWLNLQGGQVRIGRRVDAVLAQGKQWQVQGETFDAVILAMSASEAARTVEKIAPSAPDVSATGLTAWSRLANDLPFEAITTVYAWGVGAALPHPMLLLRSTTDSTPSAEPAAIATIPAPAQFVFDRAQLGGPPGLLAFVVSASATDRHALQAQVLRQAQQQLGLSLHAVQTIVEKRATFACTPGLQRPASQIAPGLLACGDYVAGPYPATLEGAVRSAVKAVQNLGPY